MFSAEPSVAATAFAHGKVKCDRLHKELTDAQFMKGTPYTADRGPLEFEAAAVEALDWLAVNGCGHNENRSAESIATQLREILNMVSPGLHASFPYECDGNPKDPEERAELMKRALRAIANSESIFEKITDEMLSVHEKFPAGQGPLSTTAANDQYINWRERVDKCSLNEECRQQVNKDFYLEPLAGGAPSCTREEMRLRWYITAYSMWDFGCALNASQARLRSLIHRIEQGIALEFDQCAGIVRKEPLPVAGKSNSTITGELPQDKLAAEETTAMGPLEVSLPSGPAKTKDGELAQVGALAAGAVPMQVKIETDSSPVTPCLDEPAQLKALEKAGAFDCRVVSKNPFPKYLCRLKDTPKGLYDARILDPKICSFEILLQENGAKSQKGVGTQLANSLSEEPSPAQPAQPAGDGSLDVEHFLQAAPPAPPPGNPKPAAQAPTPPVPSGANPFPKSWKDTQDCDTPATLKQVILLAGYHDCHLLKSFPAPTHRCSRIHWDGSYHDLKILETKPCTFEVERVR